MPELNNQNPLIALKYLLACFFIYVSFSEPLLGQSLYQKAIDQFNDNQVEAGFTLLDSALRRNSQDQEARFARSYYSMLEGKYRQALVDYHFLLDKNDQDPELFFYRGQAYQALEMPSEAEADYLYSFQLDSTQANVASALGQLYFSMELYQDALFYLNRALKLDPKEAFALYYRAYTHHEMGELDKAFLDASNYTKLVPEDPDGDRLLGLIFLSKGKYSTAEAIYEKMEKNDALTLEEADFYHWGKTLYHLKKYEDALFLLKLPQEVEDSRIYHYLGKTYYSLNQSDSALLAINQALELEEEQYQEDLAPYFYDRAVIHYRLRKNKAAEEDLLFAIFLMPELGQQHKALHKDLALLGDAFTMLQMDQKKPKIDSVIKAAFLDRAELMIANGDSNQALFYVQQALDRDSIYSRSFTVKAKALAMMRQFDQALKTLNHADSLAAEDPLKAQNAYLRALIYHDLETFDKAQEYIQKALKLDGQEAAFYEEQALLFQEKEDWKQALSSIQSALRIEPDNSTYLEQKAFYHLKLEEYTLALDACEALLEQNSDQVLAYYYRAQAYFALNKYSEATRDLRFILELYPNEEEVWDFLESVEKAQKD